MVIKLVSLYFLLQCFIAKAFAGISDTAGGIQFETQSTWKGILAKAKEENKMIFVDCYATWCGPCKQMDREVYAKDTVAKIYNKGFICVKMQMDSSSQDGETTKRRYRDADFLRKKYRITGYPTFLFFDPSGELVDHRMGAMDATAFLRLGMGTMDPKTSYYVLLEGYEKGERDLVSMSMLIWTALRLMDTSVANKVGVAYFRALDLKDWFVQSNIRLLRVYTKSSKDPGFEFFYRHSGRIDTVMESDVYAEELVQAIIFQEMVKPWWNKSAESDTLVGRLVWTKQIAEKYGGYYSDRVLLYTQMQQALRNKQWRAYTRDLINYINKYGPHKDPLLDFVLNNSAWAIFQHSRDSLALEVALSWSGQALLLNSNPNYMDTYANICYKKGERAKAMMWEEVAVRLEPDSRSYRENLIKMRNQEPTWPMQ